MLIREELKAPDQRTPGLMEALVGAFDAYDGSEAKPVEAAALLSAVREDANTAAGEAAAPLSAVREDANTAAAAAEPDDGASVAAPPSGPFVFLDVDGVLTCMSEATMYAHHPAFDKTRQQNAADVRARNSAFGLPAPTPVPQPNETNPSDGDDGGSGGGGGGGTGGRRAQWVRFGGNQGSEEGRDHETESESEYESESQSEGEAQGPFTDPIEDHLLDRLKQIVSATPGTTVVLSSDWRVSPISRDHVAARLAEKGIKMVGSTPIAKVNTDARPAEILEWLSRQKFESTPRYVALDDRHLLSEVMGSQLEGFVHVDPRTGLSEQNVVDAIAVLAASGARADSGCSEEEWVARSQAKKQARKNAKRQNRDARNAAREDAAAQSRS